MQLALGIALFVIAVAIVVVNRDWIWPRTSSHSSNAVEWCVIVATVSAVVGVLLVIPLGPKNDVAARTILAQAIHAERIYYMQHGNYTANTVDLEVADAAFLPDLREESSLVIGLGSDGQAARIGVRVGRDAAIRLLRH